MRLANSEDSTLLIMFIKGTPCMCFNFPQTRDNQWFEKVQCSEKIKGFLVILILLHIYLRVHIYLLPSIHRWLYFLYLAPILF